MPSSRCAGEDSRAGGEYHPRSTIKTLTWPDDLSAPALSKVVALECGPHGVTSNCVNPGYVRTPLVGGQIADQARAHGISEDQVLATVMLEGTAVKRLVEPEEVAETVAFLCSPHAAAITGTDIVIEGGHTAR